MVYLVRSRSLAYVLGLSMFCLLTSHAKADFSGPYDLSNWVFSNTNADGSWSFNSGPPVELFLTGGDNGSGLPGTTNFTFTAFESGTVSFNWGYNSTDSGDWDGGGWLLNGVYTQLANNAAQVPNFDGFTSFNIQVGDVFGFRVRTEDNFFDPGVLGITNFNVATAPVPEPSTIAFIGLTVAGGVYGYRKKKANKQHSKKQN